jgi:hypothetical protein
MHLCEKLGVSMRTLSSLLAATLLWAGPASAQVVISEINFTPQSGTDDRWIELVNLGANRADLTNWALFYATKTPGMPGNYWWAFPAGTSLPSGGFLRVHWFEPIKSPNPTPATDIYTGTTLFHFLFGYGGEPLQRSGGALGLLSSTSNASMNDPAIYEDWVGWGSSGFRREGLAIANNRWLLNDFVRAPTGSESIALDYAQQAEPTPSSAFFLDSTPTPNGPNASGTLVRPYGTACAVGAINAPTMELLSPPVSGNAFFAVRVRGTNGTTRNELVTLAFAVGSQQGIVLPTPFFTCPIWLELQFNIFYSLPAAGGGQTFTDFPLPLTNVPPTPSSIFVQALVLLSPPSTTDHAGSAGLEVKVGG